MGYDDLDFKLLQVRSLTGSFAAMKASVEVAAEKLAKLAVDLEAYNETPTASCYLIHEEEELV